MEQEGLGRCGRVGWLIVCALVWPGCRQPAPQTRAGERAVAEAEAPGSAISAPSTSGTNPVDAAAGGQGPVGERAGVGGATTGTAGTHTSSVDPGTLPQTDEKPQVNTEHFRQLAQALFDAIKNDDAELALPYFFPKTAYAQVKAIKNPDQDWERRLVAAFRRDIHGYHRAVGPDAHLLGLLVSPANTRFMKRGAEGNRLGYFRTTRASLTYADAKKREHALLVSSLISWRGQWYVVHLNGFQ